MFRVLLAESGGQVLFVHRQRFDRLDEALAQARCLPRRNPLRMLPSRPAPASGSSWPCTQTGKKNSWNAQLIRRYLISDLYKTHTFEEVRELVSQGRAIAPDGSLEVSGDVISVCEMEILLL
jgi:hypothetical protein